MTSRFAVLKTEFESVFAGERGDNSNPNRPDQPNPNGNSDWIQPQPINPQPNEPQPDGPQPNNPPANNPRPNNPQPDNPQPDYPQPNTGNQPSNDNINDNVGGDERCESSLGVF